MFVLLLVNPSNFQLELSRTDSIRNVNKPTNYNLKTMKFLTIECKN